MLQSTRGPQLQKIDTQSTCYSVMVNMEYVFFHFQQYDKYKDIWVT